MKNVKRFFTALLALALVFGNMVFAPVNKAEAATDTAYIAYADGSWTSQFWYDGNSYEPVVATTAEVTGAGQYTVGLDFTGTALGYAEGLSFAGLMIKNGETNFANYCIQIDSIVINGAEIAFTEGYTSSDDSVETRMNIFNEWVPSVPTSEDVRAVDGTAADASPIIVDRELFAQVQTIEITFTYTEPVEQVGVEAAVPAPSGEPSTAYIAYADGSWTSQFWYDGNSYAPVVATTAEVTGAGQYTVGLDFTGTDLGYAEGMSFSALMIKDGEANFPQYCIQLDKIVVNGAEISFTEGYTTSDDGLETRMNLFNEWVAEVPYDSDTSLVRAADGDATGALPIIIDRDSIPQVQTIEVTFTLVEPVAQAVGFLAGGAGGDTAAEEEYVIPDSFLAFMMFSCPSGAWEVYDPGFPGDAWIAGDGVWEVYLKAEDIGATEKADAGQVFLVDIEGLGKAMKAIGTLADDGITHDVECSVEVYVDGEKVRSKSKNILSGDLEGKGRFRLELYNEWGSGTKDMPVVQPDLLTPESEIRVVFMITGTGFNTEEGAAAIEAYKAANATPTPSPEPTATPTPEPTATQAPAASEDTASSANSDSVESSSDNTGLIIGIVAAVVVIIVVVVVIILNKKKNAK